MDLSLKTKRGAVISVHFGKIITTNLWESYGWYEIIDSETQYLLRQFKSYKYDVEGQSNLAKKILELHPDPNKIGKPYRREKTTPIPSYYETETEETHIETTEGAGGPTEEVIDQNFKRQAAQRLIKFFSEFTFTPAIRFVNTLANSKNYTSVKKYISNYMSLCDHPDKDAISDKIKSDEFKDIVSDILKCASGNLVNTRLEIYYGPAGTGKTTAAINKYPNAKVTVCNENMDSTDLMKTFSFNDENGNPVFKPSSLQEDMINGNPHILDEINLLPMSSLRYLQGILDGKKQIEFEGKIIDIADGFKIIGTMNLIVNGQVFNLPEPIVDRASEINSYEINADILADYAF